MDTDIRIEFREDRKSIVDKISRTWEGLQVDVTDINLELEITEPRQEDWIEIDGILTDKPENIMVKPDIPPIMYVVGRAVEELIENVELNVTEIEVRGDTRPMKFRIYGYYDP